MRRQSPYITSEYSECYLCEVVRECLTVLFRAGMLGNLRSVSTRSFLRTRKLTIGLVLPVEAVVHQNV
jgi:hypothetical protein